MEKNKNSVRDFLPEDSSKILAALINGRIYHLDDNIAVNKKIEWLTLDTEAGARVYQRTLCLILFTAIEELFPEYKVRILYSISNGLYCENVDTDPFDKEQLYLINRRMMEIVFANEPLDVKCYPIQDAIKLFQSKNAMDTIKLLTQVDEEGIKLYSCRNTIEYFYEPVADMAGKVALFELLPDINGFLLRFPQSESKQIPSFISRPNLANGFKEAGRWAGILDCRFISDLNHHNTKGNFPYIAELSEAFHTQKIIHIADQIAERKQMSRVICIAGPSSSGKTTFAKRLKTYMQINGLKPITISIDDYFKNREDSPKNPDGSYDFEHLEAIDLDFFNTQLQSLLAGEKVAIPKFNFITGQREKSGIIAQVGAGECIIIEGIHGLNDRLTTCVPREEKVKIYVSALNQLALDNHNRISTTDTRLIRRLVRDSLFRGATAELTLNMWRSVREGEEEFIFPFQEEADIIFNSTLIYELPVLKYWAEPLLRSVKKSSKFFDEAQNLLQFLDYIKVADHRVVLQNSLLREFIG